MAFKSCMTITSVLFYIQDSLLHLGDFRMHHCTNIVLVPDITDPGKRKQTMTRILHIDASPQGSNSISRKLTAAVIKHLKAESPEALISHRDLIATPVPHLGGELLQVLRPTAD